jgi:hypothetical protein
MTELVFFLPDESIKMLVFSRSVADKTVHLIHTSDWHMSAKLRAILSGGVFAMMRSDMKKVQAASLNRACYDLAILEGIGGSVPSNTREFLVSWFW